jgi:hypothetical protein
MVMLTHAQERTVAQWLKRMSGQSATPFGMPLDYLRFVQHRRLAVFDDCAGGRWHVTECGWAFYQEQMGEAAAA